MSAPRWILLAGVALAAVLWFLWLGSGPRITNEFGMGDVGEPTFATHELAQGSGFHSGPTISNAFVSHHTMRTGKAGRYSSGGNQIQADGQTEAWHAEFREGPWCELRGEPCGRLIQTGTGKTWLAYAVRIAGAITPDGSQWLFRPEVTGQGPGAEFAVAASCSFFPMSRALTLTITEKLGDEPARSYELVYDVAFDGELVWRGR